MSSFRVFFFLIASLYILLTEQKTRVLFFVCLISQFFPTSISLLPKYRIYNTGGFRTGPLHQTSPANNSGFPPLGEPSNGVRHTGSISSLGSDNGSSSSGVNSKRRSPPNSDPYSNGNNSNGNTAGGHPLKSRAERVPSSSSSSTGGKMSGGLNRGGAPLKSLVAVPDHLKPPVEVSSLLH